MKTKTPTKHIMSTKRAADTAPAATQDTRNVRPKPNIPRCPACRGPLIEPFAASTCLHNVCYKCAVNYTGNARVCPVGPCMNHFTNIKPNEDMRRVLADVHGAEYEEARRVVTDDMTLFVCLEVLSSTLGAGRFSIRENEFSDRSVRAFLRFIEKFLRSVSSTCTYRERVAAFNTAVGRMVGDIAVSYASGGDTGVGVCTVSVASHPTKCCTVLVGDKHVFTLTGSDRDGGIGLFMRGD